MYRFELIQKNRQDQLEFVKISCKKETLTESLQSIKEFLETVEVPLDDLSIHINLWEDK